MSRPATACRSRQRGCSPACTTQAGGAGGEAGSKTLLAAAADFDKHMTPIEEELIQVNMKASEDNLRYPNRLNEQYDTFIATIDADDVAPTVAQQEVYAGLHRRLVEQLDKWKTLANTIMKQYAPWAPYLNVQYGDTFNSDMDLSCYVNHVLYQFDFALICHK